MEGAGRNDDMYKDEGAGLSAKKKDEGAGRNKGGKNEARTEGGENKILPGGLVDRTRLAKRDKNEDRTRTARTRNGPMDSWQDPARQQRRQDAPG